MLSKTSCFILHLQKFKDHTSILHAYTKEYGRVNFMVYGVGGKNKKINPAMFYPLNKAELIFDNQSNKNIQILKDIEIEKFNYSDNIIKSSISVFIAEVLYIILQHPQPDQQLYDFINHIVEQLDGQNNINNIPLYFLLHLADFLGITPDIYQEDKPLKLSDNYTSNSDNQTYSTLLTDEIILLRHIYQDYSSTLLGRNQRQQLMKKLIYYYENQIENFRTPKSLDILQQVFD